MDLGIYPGPYARAHLLIQIVGSWKATEMRVSGSPKPLVPVQSMIKCARGWLRRAGACRAAFPAGPWPKCELWCRRFDSFRGHGPDLRRFAVAVWLVVRDERDLNVDRARLRLEGDLQLQAVE